MLEFKPTHKIVQAHHAARAQSGQHRVTRETAAEGDIGSSLFFSASNGASAGVRCRNLQQTAFFKPPTGERGIYQLLAG